MYSSTAPKEGSKTEIRKSLLIIKKIKYIAEECKDRVTLQAKTYVKIDEQLRDIDLFLFLQNFKIKI
jgi:hypothetical protein